ncbi:MAG: amidase family protein [Pseudorhodoplanes sp.]
MTAAGGATGDDRFGAFVARLRDPARGIGPLAGLRLAVKDNIAVKGQSFTAGLPLYAERLAAETAPAVRRLTDAGASLVGMTRTDAGGFGVTTPQVTHPLLPGRSVGGSSGGNAAVLAADLADIALGTDTGGSVRIPAACCGLFGFKPSLGAVPQQGLVPMSASFDTIGLMARDMAPLARAAEVLLAARIPDIRNTPIRLGIDPRRLAESEPAIRETVERTISAWRQRGIEVQPVALPGRERCIAAHGTIVLSEARLLYDAAMQHTPERLPETVRRALAAARHVTPAAVAEARAEVAQIRDAFTRACSGLDAVVTPTLPVLPPPREAHRVRLLGQDVSVISALIAETCLANITGGPALAMPCAGAADDFVSLQLGAPHGRDLHLLAGAARLLADPVAS